MRSMKKNVQFLKLSRILVENSRLHENSAQQIDQMV